MRNQFITTGCLAWLFASMPVSGQVAFDESLDAMHERAISLAREEKHSAAISILDTILVRDPKNYPVQRDYVIVLTWMGARSRLRRPSSNYWLGIESRLLGRESIKPRLKREI